jgi:hypothetical protein
VIVVVSQNVNNLVDIPEDVDYHLNMKLFDKEYIIEIYNERKGEWEEHRTELCSKDDAIKTLEEYRQYYFNSKYRLCELTISKKVLEN